MSARLPPAIAAFPGSSSPRLVAAPGRPAPGPGQVLCRTLELGVCGTDRDILRSGQPGAPLGADCLLLGHECLARVEEVGPGVTSPRPGDLVVPVVRRPLPDAPPNARRVDMLPWGRFTERGIWREHGFSAALWLDEPRHLFAAPSELAGVAVLAEPLAVVEKGVHEALAIQQARLGAGAWSARDASPRVLVTGLGPIAFAALAVCHARGWPAAVWGRDAPTTFRAELVRAWGARYLAPGEAAAALGDAEENGFDLVLECTGADTMLADAACALASCGVMVWLGSSRDGQPAAHNLAEIMRRAVVGNHVHLGSVNAAPRDFAAALRDLATLRRDRSEQLAALVTDRTRPEQALPHYEQRRPQGVKAVVMYAD